MNQYKELDINENIEGPLTFCYGQVKQKVTSGLRINYWILMEVLKRDLLHPAKTRGSPPRG